MTAQFFRRWFAAMAAGALLLALWVIAPDFGVAAGRTILMSFREMVFIIPPIFVLIGLLDVWVPREVMVQRMGPGSGTRGAGLAFMLGSVAAGPLYAAFPVTTVLLRKGCSSFNVTVFLGAWSTTKLPMFLFEYASLGAPFAITRLLANIPAILIIAAVLARFFPPRLSGED